MQSSNPGAIVLQALRNMLRARIRSAAASLGHPRGPGDDDVHSARKDLKSACAILRLLRGSVGERRYSALNSRLRDAARPWSRVRDSAVLLVSAASIQSALKDPADRRVVQRLIQSLRGEHVDNRDRLSAQAAKSTLSELTRADRTVAAWPLDAPAGALSGALERLYRKGRQTMQHAREAPSDEALHEARKRAKYLMLALEALETIGVCRKTGATKQARSIGEDLGADHDLALIHPMIAERSSATLSSANAEKLIARRRTSLRRKAFDNGEVLYGRKTTSFVASLKIR